MINPIGENVLVRRVEPPADGPIAVVDGMPSPWAMVVAVGRAVEGLRAGMLVVLSRWGGHEHEWSGDVGKLITLNQRHVLAVVEV